MFPISARGTITFAGEAATDVEQLTFGVKERIASYKPSAITARGNCITFAAGPIRPVLSANLLVPISRGTVEVTKDGPKTAIVYQLWFNEVVIGGSLLAIFLAHASPAAGDAKLLVFMGFWLLFVGGNYALGLARFRSMLRDAVRTARAHRNELAERTS